MCGMRSRVVGLYAYNIIETLYGHKVVGSYRVVGFYMVVGLCMVTRLQGCIWL